MLQRMFRLDIRKKLFSERVQDIGTILRETVESPALEMFKK